MIATQYAVIKMLSFLKRRLRITDLEIKFVKANNSKVVLDS